MMGEICTVATARYSGNCVFHANAAPPPPTSSVAPSTTHFCPHSVERSDAIGGAARTETVAGGVSYATGSRRFGRGANGFSVSMPRS
jgi:hypothetical protein